MELPPPFPSDESGQPGPSGNDPPPTGDGTDADPPDLTIRRHLIEQALTSIPFRNAIEAMLHGLRGRAFRWDALQAEAQEVAQEVALRALDRLASYDPARALPLPWLMGFAVNVMRERSRSRFREVARTLSQSSCTDEQWQAILNQLSVEPPPSDEPNPVWQAVRQLKTEQQRLLRLRFVENRSYATIAHALGLAENAVKMRVYRAIRSLRDRLAPGSNP